MNADGCCQATIGCFKGNPDCVALQDCMLKCGGGTTTGPTADGGTIITAGKTLFITEVYPGTQGTCAGCHLAAGPGPQFYLPTADGSYTQFKGQGFHLANSSFVNKGAHQGPALTAAQKATIAKWVAAEAGGGGGGKGGGGDGGGGGDAGGTKAECQATCKANHAGSVAKWSAYNTCVTSTCGSSCL